MRSVWFLAVLAVVACSRGGPASQEASRGPRLVILGFDGVDPRRVEAMIQNGELPHLAALGKQGFRGALATTNPPQSPVAWSTFATGLPPGEHGVFDFVGRSAERYTPEIATTRINHASLNDDALQPAEAVNLRRGDAFWDVIARRGIPVQTLAVPYAYPPVMDGAPALAGLGAPDVRGTNSSFTLLTSDAARGEADPPAGGQVALLSPIGDGAWRAMVQGPRLQIDGEARATSIAVVVRAKGEALQVEWGGRQETLAVGQTGTYGRLAFTPAPSLTVRAVTRITVRRAGRAPELYLEPLSIDPAEPYLPLSNPTGFAAALWQSVRPIKTVGWIDDTSALEAGAMDEEQFMHEAFEHMHWLSDALTRELAGPSRLLVAVFTSTDRIAHMFYRYLDARHPAHPSSVPPELAAALNAAYVEMDRIVGNVAATLGPNDVLLVMSDHGFASFRRGFNVNSWLVQNKFLVLKPGVREGRDFFRDVDWSRSKAYALGTGSIYLNLRGRESAGMVAPGEAGAVVTAIRDGLRRVRDGKQSAVSEVYVGDQVFAGSDRRDAPDLRVAVADGYRASWATSLGAAPHALFDDNQHKWSGDHASARPEDVPGILLSNRKLGAQQPNIQDLAVTAYRFFDLPAPAGLAGRPLFD